MQLKPILIAIVLYAVTYVGSAWVGDSDQNEFFRDYWEKRYCAVILSPATRRTPYDHARPPIVMNSAESSQGTIR